MADLGSSLSGIEKLSNSHYGYWKSCMESYLQGQDLWETVAGSDADPPEKTPVNAEALRKWKIRAELGRRCLLSKHRCRRNC